MRHNIILLLLLYGYGYSGCLPTLWLSHYFVNTCTFRSIQSIRCSLGTVYPITPYPTCTMSTKVSYLFHYMTSAYSQLWQGCDNIFWVPVFKIHISVILLLQICTECTVCPFSGLFSVYPFITKDVLQQHNLSGEVWFFTILLHSASLINSLT